MSKTTIFNEILRYCICRKETQNCSLPKSTKYPK